LTGPSTCAHAKFGIVTLDLRDLRDLQLRLVPRRGLNLRAVMRAGRLFGAAAIASMSYDVSRKLGAREAF